APPPEPQPEAQAAPHSLALDFAVEASPAVMVAREAKAAALAAALVPADPLASLFEGDTNSLVAWAVGSAEGTRTPNGAFNPAYNGHTDPGNRVWNMGTFSYQHGAKTPEEADQKQLARLKNQADVLRDRALKHGLNLTLEETLNGLDLANQSPLASIGRVGYIERLVEAKANGYEGYEAILVARTRAYINPRTGGWNAPGLGNTELSIRRDQKRRADAVAKAIAAYEAKDPDLLPQTWTLVPPKPDPASLIALAQPEVEPVDEILQMWTSPSDPVAPAEPVAAEPAETTPSADSVALAASDDPLAALWQITTHTVSQLRPSPELPSDHPQSPQAAALFGGWLNGEQASEASNPETDSRQPTAAETPEEPQMAAFFGGWLNGEQALEETSTQPPQEPSPASPVVATVPEEQSVAPSDAAAEEPAMVADASDAAASQTRAGDTPPTWAATREANQASSLPMEGAANPEPLFPGAVPESAVYTPMATSPEAADLPVETSPPEAALPALDLPAPPVEAVTSDAENLGAELPIAVVEPPAVDDLAASAAAEQNPETPVPSATEPASGGLDAPMDADVLNFESVDVDAMEQPKALDVIEPSEQVDYKRSSAEGVAL
ncbi:hypothetical protein IQ254_19375, partial [Nodosilinea sp. LEGE 07088]|uniref:hypothetical protein n=1 Tax=Nodosilinea sp. LEGE 07088 TaxID=2777968 RepID=UPI0018829899